MYFYCIVRHQGAAEVIESEGRCWKRCNVKYFAELLECFYSCFGKCGGWMELLQVVGSDGGVFQEVGWPCRDVVWL